MLMVHFFLSRDTLFFRRVYIQKNCFASTDRSNRKLKEQSTKFIHDFLESSFLFVLPKHDEASNYGKLLHNSGKSRDIK